jgi:hypothetical protein
MGEMTQALNAQMNNKKKKKKPYPQEGLGLPCSEPCHQYLVIPTLAVHNLKKRHRDQREELSTHLWLFFYNF